ncbi:transposase [Bacillus freudenreichii]|nr:transposase [Bacillus freudenreichii]VEF47502.1 transposase [Bacillus freudenreichii]VEF48217.1 transposase [Bacillus freudenreichii]VEF48254.1 transposase [Bacillus freudenreichii]VEF48887.1 transposase [Bacillus freudenreichii]
MSKRMTKHTLDERIQAVICVIEDKKSVTVTAREYGVNKTTIQAWVRKYQANGVDGLKEAKKWKRYSEELKMQAVDFYLKQEAGLKTTCEKFNISDPSVLRRWVKHYTSGKEMKSTSKGRGIMNKGRKTTLRERMEIVQYTIANDFNYQEATRKYQVSYQQVYSWVRRYQQDGEQGLQDRRGKSLESKPTLTEEEKLQLRIKELEHRNQYLEAENGLLKKLKDIERGLGLHD